MSQPEDSDEEMNQSRSETDTTDVIEHEIRDLGPQRKLPPLKLDWDTMYWWLMAISAVIFSIYHIYYAYSHFVPRGQHTVISIGLAIIVIVATGLVETERTGMGRKMKVVFDLVLTGAIVFATYYFFVNYDAIGNRLFSYTQLEYVLSTIVLVTVIEMSRRAYGNVIGFVIIAMLGYAYFGPYLPSELQHGGLTLGQLVEQNVLVLLSGVYGSIAQIGPTWIAVFLIYAGFLEAYGALDMFMTVGEKLGGRFRSGIAQVGVVSSFFMGSISGSAAANVATTGSFTIPLMKKHGFSGRIAGAIESTASSGGQVMPPVMGATAFLMAAILDYQYWEIVKFGTLPAVLFYLSIFISVHILTLKLGISQKLDTDEIGSIGFVEGLPVIASVAVLIYYLGVVQLGPLSSALYAIITLVVLRLVWTGTLSDQPVKQFSRDTIRALQIGGTVTAPLIIVISGIAVFINMVNVGGFVQFLTFTMLDLSGGSLLLLLFLAMVLSILMGMGLPTAAAYIIVAIMVGPTIVEFGLPQIYGHMFVFYAAILSALTPPVAIACMVACKIAEADFFETCRESLKVAAPAFILPYTFVLHRNLLVWDVYTIPVFLLVLVGIISVIIALHGHFYQDVLLIPRSLLLVGGMSILFTDARPINIAGITLVGLVITYLRFTEDRLPQITSQLR
jgi:TRAP transporter 4TM/12TM fusion protein